LIGSYLLMEEIAEATDLAAYLRKGCSPDTDLIRQTAHLVAKLHDEGFSHRDLKETNLILSADSRVYLIDLDGLEFVGKVDAGRAGADLARLEKGMAKFVCLNASHRRIFLRSYCRQRGLKRVPRLGAD
jgi:tRNA A-37 threonylcarbamoyl transferase component Bud32